jgi:hypothetical protein
MDMGNTPKEVGADMDGSRIYFDESFNDEPSGLRPLWAFPEAGDGALSIE